MFKAIAPREEGTYMTEAGLLSEGKLIAYTNTTIYVRGGRALAEGLLLAGELVS